MTLARRRLVVALVGGLLASAGPGLVAGAESSPESGACTAPSGVTVVVDFGTAGGGVQTRCAAAPVNNGFEALSKAGFEITNVRSQPGFLSQIDAIPTSDCAHIPSASQYWSYWHAARGGSWIYSTSGASRTPPPGSVEGWAFGASAPPSAAPPAPITTTTTTRPSSPTSAPASSSTVANPNLSTTLDRAATTASTVAGAVRPYADSTTSTSPLAGAGGVTTKAGGTRSELSAAKSPDDGSGSAAGLIVASVLVAAVGAVGVRTARRRARDAVEST